VRDKVGPQCVTEGSTHLLDNAHESSPLQRCCARLHTFMANFTRRAGWYAAGRGRAPRAAIVPWLRAQAVTARSRVRAWRRHGGRPRVVVELDMNCRVRWKARFSRKECSLAFGKKCSTLLKTPFKAASKLGKSFTEHETAIHTCSQCLHKHFLQLQLKSTPALHRISHRFFPASPKLLFQR
jgi:hypothetical protein